MGDISEFSWGSGNVPNPASGYPLSAFDRLRATRLTDPSNPEASEDDVYSPNVSRSEGDPELGTYASGTLRAGATQPVTEERFAPTAGQHRVIHSDRYNPPSGGRPKHYPDGYQDGAGEEWRNSVPPNPVT